MGTCSGYQDLVDTAFCISFLVLRLDLVNVINGLHKAQCSAIEGMLLFSNHFVILVDVYYNSLVLA